MRLGTPCGGTRSGLERLAQGSAAAIGCIRTVADVRAPGCLALLVGGRRIMSRWGLRRLLTSAAPTTTHGDPGLGVQVQSSTGDRSINANGLIGSH